MNLLGLCIFARLRSLFSLLIMIFIKVDLFCILLWQVPVSICSCEIMVRISVSILVALIQELLQIRALYWLNTLFAVKFWNCFITMIYN